MTEVTRLEARYVVRSKLESLLQELFGGQTNYSVKVSTASLISPMVIADVPQSQGDVMEVTAPRTLTEVRHLFSNVTNTWD